MDIIHIMKKGKMLNTMEKFHIYEARIDNQINDKGTVRSNIIFDTLILKDTDREHITLEQLVPPYIYQSQVLLTRTYTTQASTLRINSKYPYTLIIRPY